MAPNKLQFDTEMPWSQRVCNLVSGSVRLFLPALLLGGGFALYRITFVAPRLDVDRSFQTALVEQKSVPVTLAANGTIEPERLINVSPKTAGMLKALRADVGESVQAGQVIAYMDDSHLQGRLIQAEGQLAAAEAIVQRLKAGNRSQEIAQATAQLQEAQAKLQEAQLTFEQNQDLYSQGAISLRELASSQATRDSIQAQVDRFQYALSLQQAGARPEEIAEAEAQVVSAQGSLQSIRAELEDTVLRAPFSGVVTRKYADPGAFVAPTTSASAENSATSSSILSLATNNQAVANVAESSISRLKVGQRVVVRADAYPGKTFEGRVVEISPEATVEQNVTSFEVTVSLTDLNNELRMGMNVDMEFEVGQLDKAVLVPTVAIVRQEIGTGVFVLNTDGKPVFTPIETGVNIGYQTEVRSGLKGNEQVLISFPDADRLVAAPREMPVGSLVR